jgi:chromosomal replication initiator protein
MREMFGWVEWQAHKDAISAQAIESKALTPMLGRHVADIQARVCKRLEVTHEQLVGKQRNHYLVLARHMAMYLCRELTSASLPEIGDAFGNRDHTTVLSACAKMRVLREKDVKIDALLEELSI